MVKESNLNQAERKAELKKKAHEKVLAQASALTNEYKKQVSTAIITAFGLVIALAWKDVVTAIIPSITTPELLAKYPFLTNLYTAAMVTAIAVFGIVLIANWSKTPEKK